MKNFIPMLTLGLVLTACGSGGGSSDNGSTPNGITENGTEDKVQVPDDFQLTQNYEGAHLTMVYPRSDSWGWWKVTGEDAKVLFESLQIKTVDTNQYSEKYGKNIICTKEVFVITRDVLKYTCSLYINYRAGTVNNNDKDVVVDRNSPHATDYDGKQLKISADTQVAELRLRGNDAKALYLTMNGTARSVQMDDGPYLRKANPIECLRSVNEQNYRCLVNIQLKNGDSIR